GRAVSFRRKLLLMFTLTVFLAVAAVAWTVSVITRRAFERSEQERTQALVAQFHREFNRRGQEVASRVEAIAGSEAASRMALDLSRQPGDAGAYVNEAAAEAKAQQLDFLEFADAGGSIISSAQWPAKFGYKEPLLANASQAPSANAFLKREELPNTAVLGLFAVRTVRVGDKPLYVIGGRRLDQEFLASLELPAGTRAMLYTNGGGTFSPESLLDAAGPVAQAGKLQPLVERVQTTDAEQSAVVSWSSDPGDSENVDAIPLKTEQGELLGMLLVGNSRRALLGVESRIRSASLLVAGLALVLAIVVSTWMAARVTRPVEQLAEAAREVAAGNWQAQVQVQASDEVGEMADAFNRMTQELTEQRERLVQAERVAAWRELARRLAHELKNPLFPLQITVENLLKAREHGGEQFDEVFRESASTLLAEIANLKAIIGRFSEFSKMPQPQLQTVDINQLVRNVLQVHQAQLRADGRPAIAAELQLDDKLAQVSADPELLHRALANLVLNAIDAMPRGGTLTLRTRAGGENACIEVSDTGSGLSKEECERLFTPYYTTKEHGTGLGLAIVQSVVSDHQGRIAVKSTPGKGTTFVIELPKHREGAAQSGANSG
ncbi:MAG TPA: ATP-binding protein, partial [Terriglobales bacterium]|nr:ATP-binding protein [Terriglobales bacterium]